MGDNRVFYIGGAVSLAVIAVLLFLFLRTSEETKNTSLLFEQYLKETKEIKSLRAEHVSTFTTLVDSDITVIQVKGTTYKKEKNKREDLEMTIPDGKKFLFRSYLLGGKLFICPNLTGNCKETETLISLSEENIIKTIEGIYQKKAITFIEGKDKLVEGNPCKELNMSFDVSKLSQKEKYFLLASSGLANPPQPEKYAESINSFSTSSCLAGGMDLEGESVLIVGKERKVTLQNYAVIKSYQLNADLSDSLFFPKFS